MQMYLPYKSYIKDIVNKEVIEWQLWNLYMVRVTEAAAASREITKRIAYKYDRRKHQLGWK